MEITREACTNMLQSTSGSQATIKLLAARLNSMMDVVSYRIMPVNVIWFNTMALSNSRFYETLKYGMLEVQEHLETFCDKREQAAMVSFSWILHVPELMKTIKWFPVLWRSQDNFEAGNAQRTAIRLSTRAVFSGFGQSVIQTVLSAYFTCRSGEQNGGFFTFKFTKRRGDACFSLVFIFLTPHS